MTPGIVAGLLDLSFLFIRHPEAAHTVTPDLDEINTCRIAKNADASSMMMRRLYMRYMMMPLDEHFDCGFGAVADSFNNAADALHVPGQPTWFLNAHLPVSFLIGTPSKLLRFS